MARPREFDEEKALDAAMHLFWRQGYEGTSLQDLTRATRMNKPSLYATFGNKEALFLRAADRYSQGPGAGILQAMALPTARETVETLLRLYADAAGEPGRPHGCLLLNGVMSCGADAALVRRELVSRRDSLVTQLRRKLERARREGELPASARPAALARYFWAVLDGMAFQATEGATPADLREVGKQAMQSWPGSALQA